MITIVGNKQLEGLLEVLTQESECEVVDLGQNQGHGITVTCFKEAGHSATAQHYVKIDGSVDTYEEPLEVY